MSLEYENVRSTTRLHSCPLVYVCRICMRDCNTMEDLSEHMQEEHVAKETEDLEEEEESDVETKPMPFKEFRLVLRANMNLKCKVSTSCKFYFDSQEKLQQHMKCHTNAKNFCCNICQMKANNWRNCSAHLWKEHQQDVDQLKCPLCEFKAQASVFVWRHMRVHAKWRSLVMRSLKRAQVKNAKKNEKETKKVEVPTHKNKYYAEKTCDICDRKFVNGKTLSKHIKSVHHKLKPFICNVCGKKTSRKAGLEIHMRQHTGEKPLKCKDCNFATRDPSVLHKHQLRHETPRNLLRSRFSVLSSLFKKEF